MSIEEKERIEWKKFYEMKEELWNLIAKETTEIDDSSGKLERWLCFTKNEESVSYTHLTLPTIRLV